MAERVVLETFNYRHEAEAVRSVLAGSGIESFVASDDCGAEDPALGLVRGIQLLVDADHLERARQVLGSAAATDDEDER